MIKIMQPFCPAVLDFPLEKQPTHPLHIVITAKGLEECPGIDASLKNEGGFIAALLPDTVSFSRNIFVNVCILNEEVPDGEDDLLHLYVTKEFLEHYYFTFTQRVFIKPIDCIPLTKVVFAARTPASYRWAQNVNWHDLSLCTFQNKALCRLHDVFLSNLDSTLLESSMHNDLFAIACEPVNQGVLTAETKVIILDDGNQFMRRAFQSNSKYFMAHNRTLSELSINYSCSNKLDIKNESQSEIKQTTYNEVICFEVEVISKFEGIFNPELIESNTMDPFNTVFLTHRILKKMNAASGTYVKVRLGSVHDEETLEFYSRDSGDDEKYRLVTICAIDESKGCIIPDMLVAYMSPQLWFNLNTHPSRLIQPECRLLMTSFRAADEVFPTVAKEVFISLVQSPCYDGGTNCDKMVKKYFSQPRFLCKNDIFGISTRDDVEFYERSCEADSMGIKPIVYFRVSVMENCPDYGALVYEDYTKMYQVGTAQFYIPVTMSSFYFDENPAFVDSPIPPGVNYYVDILEEIIEPILGIQHNCCYSVNSNILVTGEAGCGKSLIVRAVCKRLNLHLYQVDCQELLGETSATIEARLKVIVEKASMFAPCIMMLKNINFIGKRRELTGEDSRVLSNLWDLLGNLNCPEKEWPTVVIATSDCPKLMDGDMSTAFLHVVNIEPLQECERLEVIESLLKPFVTNFDVSPAYLAQRTAGFVLSDLCTLITETTKNCHVRLKELLLNESAKFEDVNLAGISVTHNDLNLALDMLHSEYAKASGAPKIPNVSWEDVGGLANVKQEILETIQFPLDHPEILEAGLRRSGVLLYGPPGTGKTLLAKAIATECALNFISIKGPELINRYVGESEGNVRAVFQQARSAVPCVLFFDELDSLAPNRGRSGDSGGVMDRVVSQLLSEIDGLNNSSAVFVIGATNRPDLIDPALLRPGRFDRVVYVGIPEDTESKLSILKALTRNLNLADDVNLLDIIECCPGNFTGADFYSLCSEAMMNRVRKNIELIESGKMQLENANSEIQTEDFISAARNITPSVSEKDISHYKKLSDSV